MTNNEQVRYVKKLDRNSWQYTEGVNYLEKQGVLSAATLRMIEEAKPEEEIIPHRKCTINYDKDTLNCVVQEEMDGCKIVCVRK